MNHTFSLDQKSKTGNLDSNFITRQYKLHLMARFMEIKSVNTKLKQSEIAKELGCSFSTLKRYKNDIIMLPSFSFLSKTNKKEQKISDTKQGPKRSQMSSNDPIANSVTTTVEPMKPFNNKNKLRGGGNIETNKNYLDEIHHNSNL